MEVLTRKYYADIVDSWIGKGNIIVIVGAMCKLAISSQSSLLAIVSLDR